MKCLILPGTYLRAPAGQRFYVEPGKQEVNYLCPVVICLYPGGWWIMMIMMTAAQSSLVVTLRLLLMLLWNLSSFLTANLMNQWIEEWWGFHSQLTFVLLMRATSCHPWEERSWRKELCSPFTLKDQTFFHMYFFSFYLCFQFLPLSG